MKRLVWSASLLFFISLWYLAGCNSLGNFPALAGTNWKLVAFGTPSNLTTALPDVNATLSFDSEKHLGGNVGCNSFGGEYTLNAKQITFGPIISTMMACEEMRMKQEQGVLRVLSGTANINLDNDRLMITSADGSHTIIFSRSR